MFFLWFSIYGTQRLLDASIPALRCHDTVSCYMIPIIADDNFLVRRSAGETRPARTREMDGPGKWKKNLGIDVLTCTLW